MNIFKKKIDWRELSFSLGIYGLFILTYFLWDCNWWQFTIVFIIWRLIDNSVSGLFERVKKIEEKIGKNKCV